MGTVNVLIAVDVEAALASGDLGANVYMVDTNRYYGSGSEGSNELVTTLDIGDTITWTVASINPGDNVQINRFLGQAVDSRYINPVVDPVDPQAWESLFQPPGSASHGTTYQYNMELSFEGRAMTFDPFLKVK